MIDYKRSENYSIPFQCGLYPPPPYYYNNVRSLNIGFRCPLDIKRKFIPHELKPNEELDTFIIVEYPESTIGPYFEVVVVLSCKYKDKPGSYLANLYVDSDAAFAAGREIWGYPKKMAEIKLSSIKENIITGSLTRKEITIFDTEVELDTNVVEVDFEKLNEMKAPVYTLKIIPDVTDNDNPLIRQLTVNYNNYSSFLRSRVIKKINFINSRYSKYDILHDYLKDAEKQIGGSFIEYCMVLTNGEVVS
jgi:acetoacetate decarboxylase